MGKGNVCVFGDYEGLYYIDWENFCCEYEDEQGNVTQDYDFQQEEWERSLYEFTSDFTKKFKSFSRCNEWTDRGEKAVLENNLFYIAVSDNEWSVAVKLIQKEQSYYTKGNIENLQAKHYKNYLEGIVECLFNQFDELGTYGGAWTSGRIRRPQ